MADVENKMKPTRSHRINAIPATGINAGGTLYGAIMPLAAALVVTFGMFTYLYEKMLPEVSTQSTAEWAKQFTDALQQSHIPPQNVRLIKQEERGNEGERWFCFCYEVIVPSYANWSHVRGRVQESLAERQITLREIPKEGQGKRFSLEADSVVFGEAYFNIAQAPFVASDDICPKARSLLRDTALKQGLSPGMLSVEAIRKVNGVQVTRFTAYFPSLAAAHSLYEAVAAACLEKELWATLKKESEDHILIQIGYQNTLCAELVCIPPPDQPQEQNQEGEANVSLQAGEMEKQKKELPPSLTPESAPGVRKETRLETAQEAVAPVDKSSEAREEDPSEEMSVYNPPSSSVASQPCRVAVILDDGGYGGSETARILSMDNRLTLAILPDTPFAQQTAQDALTRGFEIMLHMPMQTNSRSKPFPGEIQVSMTREEIQARARECLDQFPEAGGANNHTGAFFTATEEKIRDFLEVVREYGIYFIDSRTSAQSHAFNVAGELGIPTAMRDVFLDNSSEPEEIRKQFRELVRIAKTKGAAIGIGHFRRNTVTVLQEELPKLEAQGIELVPASEMVL